MALDTDHIADDCAQLGVGQMTADRHLAGELEKLGAARTKAQEVAALLARARAARDRVAGAARLAEEDAR